MKKQKKQNRYQEKVDWDDMTSVNYLTILVRR